MPIRILTPDDAVAYRAIRIEALQERPPAFGSLAQDEPCVEEIAKRLESTNDRCFFGAFEGEQLVGTLRLSRYDARNEKHRVYIAGFYVRPAFRRHGHGSALLKAAMDRAKSDPIVRRINLNVVTTQRSAIALYEKFGFTVCGIEREAFECDGRFYDEQLMTYSASDANSP